MYGLFIFGIFMPTVISATESSGIVKTCPDYVPVDNFNIKALNGTWYEAARYPNEFENTNCSRFEYTFKEEDKLFLQLVGSSITEDSPDYFESTFGLAPGAGDKGILLHEISYGNPRTTLTILQDIVAVEYDKYYIGVECKYNKETNTINDPPHYACNWVLLYGTVAFSFLGLYFIKVSSRLYFRREYAWVVTRSKSYGDEVKAAIDNYLKTSKDIDTSRLKWLDSHDVSC